MFWQNIGDELTDEIISNTRERGRDGHGKKFKKYKTHTPFWFTKKIKGKLSNDYVFSYLWLGCGNNFENCDDEFRWNFYGDISYAEVIINGKTIFQSKCGKKTKYKVYDESQSGNHLVKYSSEWFGE